MRGNAIVRTILALCLVPNAFAEEPSSCGVYGYGADAMTKRFGVEIPQTCLEVGNATRCFNTYVPPCVATYEDNGATVPVLMVMHGRGNCPLGVEEQYGWIEKANDECFVVVYPQGNIVGLAPFDIDTNCWLIPGGANADPAPVPDGPEAIPCCCNDQKQPLSTPLTADVDFLWQTLQSVVAAHAIDTRRIYVSGHSNGCIAAHAVHRLYSHAVAAMSCTVAPATTMLPKNYLPTPQMSIRGLLDNEVPTAGVSFDWPNGEGSKLVFPSAEASFQQNLVANGCQGEVEPEVTLVPEMDVPGINGTLEHRKGKDCGADTELVLLSTAGHAVHNNYTEKAPGAANTTIDVTSLQWDFLSRYTSSEAPDLTGSPVVELGADVDDEEEEASPTDSDSSVNTDPPSAETESDASGSSGDTAASTETVSSAVSCKQSALWVVLALSWNVARILG